MKLSPVAIFHGPFREKFGIPRQSGLADTLEGTVVLEKAFASPEALRGLEAFGRIWLIWGFSANRQEGWSPTVRPPRLGGNRRIGVFASRSPFRPNSLAMSAVKLVSIEMTADRGPLLHVTGADLLDGTPIYDIKPYIPYADCIPEATDGYTAPTKGHRLEVEFAPDALDTLKSGEGIDSDTLSQIEQLLSLDPRVSYDTDPDKVWGMAYGSFNVRFKVAGDVATVVELTDS